jgi:hypothetical protein
MSFLLHCQETMMKGSDLLHVQFSICTIQNFQQSVKLRILSKCVPQVSRTYMAAACWRKTMTYLVAQCWIFRTGSDWFPQIDSCSDAKMMSAVLWLRSERNTATIIPDLIRCLSIFQIFFCTDKIRILSKLK